jgi:hypothetical protein
MLQDSVLTTLLQLLFKPTASQGLDRTAHFRKVA